MLNRFALSVFFLAAAAAPAGAQMLGTVNEASVIERIGTGEINWTVGTVRASGIGAPPEKAVNSVQAAAMAERAAVTVARRNLLEIIKGVRVDSQTLVENFITTSDIIRSRISGYIKGAQVVEKRTLAGGGYEVVMEIKMRGPFADSILPHVTRRELPQGGVPENFVPRKVYTGLVINAKGLSVRPAMAPKVVNENGEEVYGSAFVNREYAIQQGMAGYSRNMLEAMQNERVTDTPLVVKALKSSGPSGSDLVISNSDAVSLKAAAKDQKFLQQCKVMVVVD